MRREDQVTQPNRPTHVSDYARACLEALAANNLGDKFSLGGAFGLLHYLDYRPTHDVDAWWEPSATERDCRQVIEVIEAALQPFGLVRKRAWGDVVSVELAIAGRVVFSFQIAHRSAQLEPPTPAPWADLLAGKMTALVERGAPCDLRDVYALCQAGLTTPRQCWQMWRRRQQLAGSDADPARARLAVVTHLERIAQHRPLAGIANAEDRAAAEQLRDWFRKEFLDVLDD